MIQRVEYFTEGAHTIARLTPVDIVGVPTIVDPQTYRGSAVLKHPTQAMQMTLDFGIPAQSIGEAFENWQAAKDAAEKTIIAKLRSQLVTPAGRPLHRG